MDNHGGAASVVHSQVNNKPQPSILPSSRRSKPYLRRKYFPGLSSAMASDFTWGVGAAGVGLAFFLPAAATVVVVVSAGSDASTAAPLLRFIGGVAALSTGQLPYLARYLTTAVLSTKYSLFSSIFVWILKRSVSL